MTETTTHRYPHARDGKDTRPWYRYFWPWFIIALPASVVVAGISTLIIAINHADSLVVDDYYREGLGINQVLAADDAARRLQLEAHMTLDVAAGAVTLQLLGDEPVAAETINFRLIHPTDSDRDLSLVLKRESGAYRGQLPPGVKGRRYLQLEGTSPQPWLLRAEVQVPGRGSIEWQIDAEPE